MTKAYINDIITNNKTAMLEVMYAICLRYKYTETDRQTPKP